MAFSNLNAELELPSVIIDMPELARLANRKKLYQSSLWTLAVLIFSSLCVLIFLEITASTRETVSADELEVKEAAQGSLKLTIQLVPENVQGAVVEVDGNVISGNPPYVYLAPTEDYHAIKIRAPGYGNMNKDVQVTSSEVMAFTLIPDSERQVGAIRVEELASLADDEFGENSDDLIEEIPTNRNAEAAKNPNQENAKGIGKSGGQKGKGAAGKQSVAVASASRKSTATPAASTTSIKGKSGNAETQIATVPAKPIDSRSNRSDTTASGEAKKSIIPSVQLYKPPKASLIINAPPGVTNRVAVSVDGQMRGYLPVLLKIDAGLHELTFVYDGHRTFQMVKLNAGQIARIVPKL